MQWDDLYIGAKDGSAYYFTGLIDDFQMSVHTGYGQMLDGVAIGKIYAEGEKKLGMGTPVFTRTPDD